MCDAIATRASGHQRGATTGNLPASASQGSLVVGRADPGSIVTVAGRRIRLSADGRFAFGIARDATGESVVGVQAPGAARVDRRITIVARDWPVERIASRAGYRILAVDSPRDYRCFGAYRGTELAGVAVGNLLRNACQFTQRGNSFVR